MSRTHRVAQWIVVALAIVATTPAAIGDPPACRAESTPTVLPRVELYTSEGCDSCPAADAWLARTFAGAPAVAVLAFHVDYWDRLGWRDRFATPAYTARQQRLAEAHGSDLVYTPQVLMQGRDRGLWRTAAVAEVLDSTARHAATTRLTLAVRPDAEGATVAVDASVRAADADHAVLALALTEDGLGSSVSAGENRGRRLEHDHVVRELVMGPRFAADGSASFQTPLSWPAERGRHRRFIAFVENRATGDVLQSVVLADCALR